MKKIIDAVSNLIIDLKIVFLLMLDDVDDYIKRCQEVNMKKDILKLCMKYASSCKNCPRNKQCIRELQKEEDKEFEEDHKVIQSKHSQKKEVLHV